MASGALTREPALNPDPASWLRQLADIADLDARRSFFLSDPTPYTLSTAECLHAEVLRLAYADVERAARLADASVWLADCVDSPQSRAFSLRSRGHVAFAQANYAPALEYYEAALELLQMLGAELDAARTLTSGLQALIYLGQYDRAFEWAERARAIFERHGDDLRLARLASNIGNILFRQDRHAEALEHYESAREPLARLGEPRDLAAVVSNMAVCSISLGRFDEAIAHYEAAREHCVRHHLTPLVAAADYNVAYLHYLRGDYIDATRLYRLSRERAQDAGDAYHLALCDLDEAEMCLELNLTAESAQLAKRAAERFQRAGMRYEQAKAIVIQAMAASYTGPVEPALRLLSGARGLFEKEQNRVWGAVIDLYQGLLLYRDGKYREAAPLARQASLLLADSPMLGKAVHCRLLEARLMAREGRAELALSTCLEILTQLGVSANPTLRFHVYLAIAEFQESLGRWDAAWEAYRSAGEEIETLRGRVLGDELKISILKDKLAVYEALVWLALWKQPGTETALQEIFSVIFQAKSRSLAEHIAFPPNRTLPSEPESERQIEDARRDFNWCYREIERKSLENSGATSGHIQDLRRRARECEERLVERLRASRVHKPLVENPAAPDFNAIRGSVPPDAVLIEYYEARGTLYAGILSREQLRIWPLTDSARVRHLVRLFQFQISKFQLGAEYRGVFRDSMFRAALAHLEALHAELIAPIRPLLAAKHLIVAPHSFLHRVPFHALYSQGRFLLDDFSISYAPSAQVFALCSARKATFGDESLVLGVPDHAAPQIEEEARQAAQALPNSRLLLGPEANETALRENGPTSRFVHIATHGLFRRDNPLFSSLRLGDSYLSLFDLYQLPLSAELVTLSGCSTGLNAAVGADELLGLTRGLLFAGAHGVVASLWDVHDLTAAKLIGSFYRRLASENKAQAMRSAMLEARADHPHPYYWAPFVLVGKYLS